MQPQTDGCWGCVGDSGGQPCQSTLISNYTECTSIKAVHDVLYYYFSLECNLLLARLAFDYLKSHIMNIGELCVFLLSIIFSLAHFHVLNCEAADVGWERSCVRVAENFSAIDAGSTRLLCTWFLCCCCCCFAACLQPVCCCIFSELGLAQGRRGGKNAWVLHKWRHKLCIQKRFWEKTLTVSIELLLLLTSPRVAAHIWLSSSWTGFLSLKSAVSSGSAISLRTESLMTKS